MSKRKNENFTPTLFSDIFNDGKFFGRNWLEKEFSQSLPPVNIQESNKEFNLEFAAPGFKKEDFKINIDNNVLNINAAKQEEKNEDTKRYTRKEFSYNSFSRSFTLPGNANAGKVDARYINGILKLSIPKLEETKTLPKKEITVA